MAKKSDEDRRELQERRALVKREFGKLNSLPPPGSTLLHSPIYVNDLVAAVAKHLGVDADQTFNNSLIPRLRKWVVKGVPSAHDAEVARCKKELDELEGRATWADAAADAACAAVKALLEPAARAIRATANAFASEEQMQELHAIVEAGDKVYLGIYAGMHEQVRNNEGYGEFCDALDAVVPDAARFPQRTTDLVELFGSAVAAMGPFEAVLEEVARGAAAQGATAKTRVAPLKHVFRVVQKHATRVDGGKPTDFETACDIVRGSVVCETMCDLLKVLRLLLQLQVDGFILIVRFKNRFKHPTAAGWADAMINFVCLRGGDAAAGHVCELQLVHATMLKARKEFGGHNAYVAFREAAELLEFVVGDMLMGAAEGPVEALEAATAKATAAAEGPSVATVADEEAAAGAAVAAQSALQAVGEVAGTALMALRWARALVPDGCDASAIADPLLERGERAKGGAVAALAAVEAAERRWPQAVLAAQARAAVEALKVVAANATASMGGPDEEAAAGVATAARTALTWASENGRTDIAKALLAAGADMNTADKTGRTALILAVENDHTEIAHALLAAGAGVTVALENGETALMLAAAKGQTGVVQALLVAGADIPFDVPFVQAVNTNGKTALMRASEEGHVETARALLQCDGQEVLRPHPSSKVKASVNVLVAASAGVNATDKQGDTALTLASMGGHTEVVRAVMAAGADVNAANDGGETALIWASVGGHTEIAQALIAAGVDWNSEDKHGKTALTFAMENDHAEVTNVLMGAANSMLDATMALPGFGETSGLDAMLAQGGGGGGGAGGGGGDLGGGMDMEAMLKMMAGMGGGGYGDGGGGGGEGSGNSPEDAKRRGLKYPLREHMNGYCGTVYPCCGCTDENSTYCCTEDAPQNLISNHQDFMNLTAGW
jgi:ankyrin repeat protein